MDTFEYIEHFQAYWAEESINRSIIVLSQDDDVKSLKMPLTNLFGTDDFYENENVGVDWQNLHKRRSIYF